MYDALLFDLDGTLIDTESIALSAGLRAFARHGLAVEEALLHRLIGKDAPSSQAILHAAFPDTDLEAVRRDWTLGFDKGVAHDLPLKPGVADLLMLTKGRTRAVVTSTGRLGAHRKIELAGLTPAFDLVVSLDDVTRAKPDPEPYLLAARRLGVAPTRCLVFEDSETGAESAHRAGCTVVQVPDILPSDGRWAHHLADSLLSGAKMAGLL